MSDVRLFDESVSVSMSAPWNASYIPLGQELKRISLARRQSRRLIVSVTKNVCYCSGTEINGIRK